MINSTRKNIKYSDFTTNFDIHPIKNDLITLTNEDSVKLSLKNIILTESKERFFEPTLGGGIYKLLFENITVFTSALISNQIKTSIENFEKRVNLLNVSVIPDEDNNQYNITIVFSLINNNNPITFSMILKRLR